MKKKLLHIFVPFHIESFFVDSHVRRVLDIVESMWIGQALQERQFDSWFSVLIESHREGVLLSIPPCHV